MAVSMNPASLDLIRDTFVDVMFAKERAATLFYNRLFYLAPETRTLFRSDLEEQGRMFVEALAKIVTGLDRLESLLPELKALAVRHVRYGVEERHYAIVGSALLHMAQELAWPMFNTGTEQAWSEAYAVVSGAMIEASRPEWQRLARTPSAHAPTSGSRPAEGGSAERKSA
jgi:hemoglobin-like flavoprotein